VKKDVADFVLKKLHVDFFVIQDRGQVRPNDD